jgi:drug/metabolite transporter (DMT)-like permease
VDAVAIVLVVVSAALHAGWNLRLHATEDRVAAMAVTGLVTGVALLPVVLWRPPLAVWPSVVVSGSAETVYGLALAGAYARGDLTATYPIGRGTAPLLVTIGAWAVLSQPPAPGAVAGAICLAAGLLLLAVRAGRGRMLHAAGLAVVVGVAIATYSVADARAIAHGTAPIAYLGATLGLQGLLTTAIIRFDRTRLRTSFRAGAAIALGSATAYALVLLAFARAPAGQVATLREVSVLFALFAAKERPGRLGWVGAALVVVGAILAASAG